MQGNILILKELFLELYRIKNTTLKSIAIGETVDSSTDKDKLNPTEILVENIRVLEIKIKKEIIKLNLNQFEDILSENELNAIYWDLDNVDLNEFTHTLDYYLGKIDKNKNWPLVQNINKF